MAASKRSLFAGMILLFLITSVFAAEKTVTRQHWAYKAIDGWAQRGLLAGYPAAAFAGPETLSRFEAASLTLRAAEGIGRQYQHQGEMIAELAAPSPTPPQPTPEPARLMAGGEAEVKAVERGPGVYPEDIAMLEKLVAEFRTELAALGTKVSELETLLASTRQRLEQVESEARRHQVSGYLQFRFSDDQAKSASTFAVRRARLNVAGPLSPKASYKVQLQLDKDSGEEVALREAYIDLMTGKDSRLRAGQAKLPIGYELPESSSDRLEPERALMMDRLFPDQRDIGVQWRVQAGADGPAFDLGLVNGSGINTSDTNDRKDLAASAHLPFSWGSAAVAAYDGRTGSGDTAQEKDRLAAGLEIGKKKTRLRGEYIVGRDLGEDVLGWYTRLSQQVGKKNTLYLKYDLFDENRDRSGDLFRRWGLGWVEEIDPRTRLTLAWETRRVGRDFSGFDDFHGDAATVQLQVRF